MYELTININKITARVHNVQAVGEKSVQLSKSVKSKSKS